MRDVSSDFFISIIKMNRARQFENQSLINEDIVVGIVRPIISFSLTFADRGRIVQTDMQLSIRCCFLVQLCLFPLDVSLATD